MEGNDKIVGGKRIHSIADCEKSSANVQFVSKKDQCPE